MLRRITPPCPRFVHTATWVRFTAILIVLCGSVIGAGADPGASVPDTAAAVCAAYEGGDGTTLLRLASAASPDPWRVADALLARHAHDAAEAFARVAKRADVEGMGAWVAARRATPLSAELRTRLAAVESAGASGHARAVLRTVEELDRVASPDAFTSACVERQRGLAHRVLGRDPEGAKSLVTAAGIANELGWLAFASICLRDAGRAAFATEDYAAALASWTERAALDTRRSATIDHAESLCDLGLVYLSLGNYASALSNLDRALRLHAQLGSRTGQVADLDLIARTHLEMGDATEALSFQKRALALLEPQEESAGRLTLKRRLGVIFAALLQEDKGLAILEDALAASLDLGDVLGAAAAHADMGEIHLALGEHEEALACYGRARETWDEAGHSIGVARACIGSGTVHQVRGDARAALPFLERALELYEQGGARRKTIAALTSMALTRSYLGDAAAAHALYERARREAESACVRDLLVRSLWGRAETHLLNGAREEAARSARQAVDGLPGVVGRLSEEQGAAARAQHAGIFEVGVDAGVGLGSDDLVCFFLESGRAGTLLEFLGRREALQAALVSGDLLEAESAARAREAEALDAYRHIKDVAGRRQIRRARASLDGARQELKAVIESIQREAKAKVGVLSPPPAPIGDIRKRVRADEALVLYGLFRMEAYAQVIQPDQVRTVRLGKTRMIERAFRGFLLDDPEEDPAASLARLARLVIEPLELPASVTRVLVSPDGILAYAPFACILGGREVACVPSGTTYGLLLADRDAKGEGVLAVGDPIYDTNEDPCLTASTRSGVDLLPLPYTRDEALAVGTVVLLGSEATEAGFRYSVAKRRRWRAVHIACHGVMDPDHPTLSALALTTEGSDDGFLTALDVFRLRIPADLVVLSACDSGVGKIVNAEGVLGLMRAFLFAGAPRVIVSLGRVDDEATRVLMEELYRHWKAGQPAARALKLAQEAVRARPGWSHPHYWANWILWGLPE